MESYTTQLILSMMVFAPGIFLLAFGLFMGILMSLEKTKVFKELQERRSIKIRKDAHL